MKFLLIRETSSLYRYSCTSFGMGMVGTVASAVATVRILDNNSMYKIYSVAEILHQIAIFSPQVVGFNLHAFNIMASTRLIREVKRRFPQICLLAGGLHTYSKPIEAADTGVHIVVKGEAEHTIIALLKSLGSVLDRQPPMSPFSLSEILAKDLDAIPGLLFSVEGRDGSTDTGPARYVEDLDSLPFINYNLFNLDDYIKHAGDEHYVTNVVITQRGCPYPCPFCRVEGSLPMVKVRENSVSYKLELVSHVLSNWRPRNMIFYDNNFTLRRQNVLGFCRGAVSKGFHQRMTFTCQTNVALELDDEVVGSMRDAGCTEVGLGIERLSERALRLIHKNRNVERIHRNIAVLRRHGIRVLANCLLGFPFDTPETVREESRLFEEIQGSIDVFAINNLLPPPGTEVYDHTPYHRWYLDERFMTWKPSFYHMVYNFSNNAWDVNYFNLTPETQDAIRTMKEHFYSMTIAKLDSRFLDRVHELERVLARISLYLYRKAPLLEEVCFYLPKKVRAALYKRLMDRYYLPRKRPSPEVST